MITVQADGRKLIGSGRRKYMEFQDSNDDGLAYLADAMTAIIAIVSHAKNKYGPILEDMLISTLESAATRKAVNEGGEKTNEDQTGNCPGC